MRVFPIMEADYKLRDQLGDLRDAGTLYVVIGIPWEMIEPHAPQAVRNHNQSLDRLAQRGGLSACEAIAVLEDRAWRQLSKASANKILADKARDFLAATVNPQ